MEEIKDKVQMLEKLLEEIKEQQGQQNKSNEGEVKSKQEQIEQLIKANEDNEIMREAFENGEAEYIELSGEIEVNRTKIVQLREEIEDLKKVKVDEEKEEDIQNLKNDIREGLRQRHRYLAQNRNMEISEANDRIENLKQAREAIRKDREDKEKLIEDKKIAIELMKTSEELSKKLGIAKKIAKLEMEQKRLETEIKNIEMKIQIDELDGGRHVDGMQKGLINAKIKIFDNEKTINAMRSEIGISADVNVVESINDFKKMYDDSLSQIQYLGQEKSIDVLEAEISEITAENESSENRENQIVSEITSLEEFVQIKSDKGILAEARQIHDLLETLEKVNGKSSLDELNEIKAYIDNVLDRRNSILRNMEGKADGKDADTVLDEKEDIDENDRNDKNNKNDKNDKGSKSFNLKEKRERLFLKFGKILQEAGFGENDDIDEKIPEIYNMIMQNIKIRDTEKELKEMENMEKFIIAKINAYSRSNSPKMKKRVEQLKRECDILNIKYEEKPVVETAAAKPQEKPVKKSDIAKPKEKAVKKSDITKPQENPVATKTEDICNPKLSKIVFGKDIEIHIQGESKTYTGEKIITELGDEIFDKIYMEEQMSLKAGRAIDKLKIKEEDKKQLWPLLVGVLDKVDNNFGINTLEDYINGNIDFEIVVDKEKMRGNLGDKILDFVWKRDTNLIENIEEAAKKEKARLGRKVSIIENDKKEEKESKIAKFFSGIYNRVRESGIYNKIAQIGVGVASKSLSIGKVDKELEARLKKSEEEFFAKEADKKDKFLDEPTPKVLNWIGLGDDEEIEPEELAEESIRDRVSYAVDTTEVVKKHEASLEDSKNLDDSLDK